MRKLFRKFRFTIGWGPVAFFGVSVLNVFSAHQTALCEEEQPSFVCHPKIKQVCTVDGSCTAAVNDLASWGLRDDLKTLRQVLFLCSPGSLGCWMEGVASVRHSMSKTPTGALSVLKKRKSGGMVPDNLLAVMTILEIDNQSKTSTLVLFLPDGKTWHYFPSSEAGSCSAAG